MVHTKTIHQISILTVILVIHSLLSVPVNQQNLLECVYGLRLQRQTPCRPLLETGPHVPNHDSIMSGGFSEKEMEYYREKVTINL